MPDAECVHAIARQYAGTETWFSKADDTVCKNANFNPTSMFRRDSLFTQSLRTESRRAFSSAVAPRYHATVTTTLSPRDKAAQDAAALVSYLRTVPSDAVIIELTDLGEHLERAIRAFHMEAIRFRAFTMSRLIKQHHDTLPAEVSGAHGRDSPGPRGRRLPDQVGHRIEGKNQPSASRFQL